MKRKRDENTNTESNKRQAIDATFNANPENQKEQLVDATFKLVDAIGAYVGMMTPNSKEKVVKHLSEIGIPVQTQKEESVSIEIPTMEIPDNVIALNDYPDSPSFLHEENSPAIEAPAPASPKASIPKKEKSELACVLQDTRSKFTKKNKPQLIHEISDLFEDGYGYEKTQLGDTTVKQVSKNVVKATTTIHHFFKADPEKSNVNKKPVTRADSHAQVK